MSKVRRSRSPLGRYLPPILLMVLAGCDWDRDQDQSRFDGHWYLVELDGESTLGSTINLEFEDSSPATLNTSSYHIEIRCDDWGQFDEAKNLHVSSWQYLDRVPTDECHTDDPNLQDQLRRMTHQGFRVQLNKKEQSLVLSTEAGQTARFRFMPSAVAD